MRLLALSVGLVLVAQTCVPAPVTLQVLQDQDQFLPGEALPVAARITNRSGQTLELGGDDQWLTFSVESPEASIVTKSCDVPVAGSFTLPSSKMATKRADLAPCFSLMQPGRYSIIATVRIKGWDHEITSPPKFFDVIEGAKLWEQDFGVPKAGDAKNAAPEVRKYVLQEARYLRSQLMLYFRLTDASGGRAFRVFPVGPMVSFSNP